MLWLWMKQIQEFDALFWIQFHSTKLLTHPNFCDTCVIGSVFKISIDTWRPHRYITLFHCSRSGLCIPEKQTYIPFPRNRFPFNSLNPFEKVKHNFRKIYSLENLYVYITVFFPFCHAIFSLSSFRVVCILWIFCFVQVRHFHSWFLCSRVLRELYEYLLLHHRHWAQHSEMAIFAPEESGFVAPDCICLVS